MLTPSAPGGGTYCDIELRYALGRGDSGIYTYAIFSHPAAYGAMGVGESRFITKLNQNVRLALGRCRPQHARMCPADWGTGVVVHAKEQRIMSKGVYKNSVEHKYSYNAVQYKIPAYGWSSTKEHIGIWFINPTIEYLSGGASKQELVCHFRRQRQPRSDHPRLLARHALRRRSELQHRRRRRVEQGHRPDLRLLQCAGAIPTTPSQADLDTLAATAGNPTVPPAWKDNATALWQDALGQAKTEKAKWPYDWVNGVDYPHKDERGNVTGQIVLNDPQAATTKLPHLTVGLAHPDYAQWRRRRRARGIAPAAATTGRAGRRGGGGTPAACVAALAATMAIGPTMPSSTSSGTTAPTTANSPSPTSAPALTRCTRLPTACSANSRRPTSPSRPARTLDLGKLEWKPVRYGKQIWEIGYPDRTGDKFFKGDGDNYWLWGWGLRYPLLFPNDITYTIGKSDYHKDWFFEQVPHGESTAWLNPEAKDPANQRFGWVKAESLEQYPQTNTHGPWRIYGRGRATTWTIKFNMDKPARVRRRLRVALAGADGFGGLADCASTAKTPAPSSPVSTNALRYNTNKSVWQEQTLDVRRRADEAGRKRNDAHRPRRRTHHRRGVRLPAAGAE